MILYFRLYQFIFIGLTEFRGKFIFCKLSYVFERGKENMREINLPHSFQCSKIH